MLRVSIVKTNSFNIESITPIAVIEDISKLHIIRKHLRNDFELWFSTEPLIGSTNDKTTFVCTNNKKYMLRVEILNKEVYFLGS